MANPVVEHEGRVLDINIAQTKDALQSAGARNVSERLLMVRYVFDIVEGDMSQWLRIRQESRGLTITHKQINDDGISGTTESGGLVSDNQAVRDAVLACGIDEAAFDRFLEQLENSINLSELLKWLESVGFVAKSIQENYRTSYVMNVGDYEVEVEIDEWPLIPPYLEIEAPNPELVFEAAELIGLGRDQVVATDPKSIYLQYGYDLDEIKKLEFPDGDKTS